MNPVDGAWGSWHSAGAGGLDSLQLVGSHICLIPQVGPGPVSTSIYWLGFLMFILHIWYRTIETTPLLGYSLESIWFMSPSWHNTRLCCPSCQWVVLLGCARTAPFGEQIEFLAQARLWSSVKLVLTYLMVDRIRYKYSLYTGILGVSLSHYPCSVLSMTGQKGKIIIQFHFSVESSQLAELSQ